MKAFDKKKRHIVGSIFSCIFLMLGSFVNPSDATAQFGREKLPEDYIVLAKILSEDFLKEEESPETLRELMIKGIVEIDDKIKELRVVKSSTNELSLIRDKCLSLLENIKKDFIAFYKSIPGSLLDRKADDDISEEVSEEDFAAMSDEEHEKWIQETIASLEDVSSCLKEILPFMQGIIKIVAKYESQNRALNNQLSRIAVKYAAPQSRNNDRVMVTYHELSSVPALIGFATAGKPLQNVTILTTMQNKQGETVTNFYFLEKLDDTWNTVELNLGFLNEGTIVGNNAVPAVAAIDVEVYSEDFSTSFTWEYTEERRCVTYEIAYQGIEFTGKLQDENLDNLADFKKQMTLTPSIPLGEHTIHFQFVRGTDKYTTSYKHDSWDTEEEKTFAINNTKLRFEPTTIKIHVAFPDTTYTIKRTLHVSGDNILPIPAASR